MSLDCSFHPVTSEKLGRPPIASIGAFQPTNAAWRQMSSVDGIVAAVKVGNKRKRRSFSHISAWISSMLAW